MSLIFVLGNIGGALAASVLPASMGGAIGAGAAGAAGAGTAAIGGTGAALGGATAAGAGADRDRHHLRHRNLTQPAA